MSDYIPPELILNILAKLPADTLLLCTSVCKTWYSIITSPSFISSLSNISFPNNEPRILIMHSTESKDENDMSRIWKAHCCIHRDNQTFDQIAKLDCPFIGENLFFTLIGSFNGLICLSDPDMEKIILWNPSLRKSLILPKPRVLFDSSGCRPRSIGFGFFPTTNDYKIVRIVYPGPHEFPPEVEIYELSIGSWRNVNAGDYSYIILNYSSQAYLNGIVHWPAYNPDKVGRTFSRLIGSFDMKNEKFGALMLPNCLRDDQLYSVFTFRESLCLMTGSWSVWVMKEYGVADSWENQINIVQNHLSRPIYFRENGDILFVKRFGNSVDEPYGLVSYDLKKNESKNIGVSGKSILEPIVSYVKSLVLINGSTDVLSKLSKDDEDNGNKKARIE